MAIHIIQPALPAYRIDFFRRLAERYGDKFFVYYSPIDMGILTETSIRNGWEYPIGPMLNPVRGTEWQVKALSILFGRDDIVVVCGAPRNLSTLLVLIKARMKGARTVWWGHYWSATTSSRRHLIRMKLAKLADALLFYTDAEVTRFHEDGFSHAGPVGALNNGIDLSQISHLRRAYKSDERERNLLFIGRLTEKARLGLLITALAEPTLAGAHLHVIGAGSAETSLRVEATAQGVANRITWHGGIADETRIAEVANRCSVFVYPGQVGLSLIHAMGYGLPCIVHHQPLHHMPEIAAFKNGATGATFCEGNAASLAFETSRLLNDSPLREIYSGNCIKVTQDRYNTSHMAERFIEFIEQLEAGTGDF
jgi:glycosyltransferase involved in cell wall biosynthesis